MTNYQSLIAKLATNARQATAMLALADTKQRNSAIIAAADFIERDSDSILEANAQDIQQAEASNCDSAFLDRLRLNKERIAAMAAGLRAIADLEDPIGQVLAQWECDNGLRIQQISVPLGVIGVIYEARPNVTADAAGLCIKSGNAVILRCGAESFNTSKAITKSLHDGLLVADLPVAAVQLIPTIDRSAVSAMMQAVGHIDILVPRGGKGLTGLVQQQSRVPTILHLAGNCHSYIHEKADIGKAAAVITNAKMRRPSICGATESVLIDRPIAAQALPALVDSLLQAGCREIRGDEMACTLDSRIIPATEDDWETEYLDAIISIKIVADINQAISHIAKYSSHHTDCIITEDATAAAKFLQNVDSAIVMHNTSTQFADGGEFGMGAEIGIATGRLHARGPVGVKQLTIYKYVVTSDGAMRK